MISSFAMRTLDRYIIREQLKIFGLSAALLLMVLLLDKIRFLADLLMNKHADIVTIGKLLLYLVPSFLTLATPLAILMSTLMVFSRFSAENEITAMKASGLSLFRLILPVLLLSIAACFATLYISTNLEHISNLRFRQAGIELLKSSLSGEVKERRFNTNFNNLLIYVNENKGGFLEGVFISDQRKPDKWKIIEARNGVLLPPGQDSAGSIALSDGVIHTFGSAGVYQTISFNSYTLRMDFSDEVNKPFEKEVPQLSIPELEERISKLQSEGKTANAEKVALYKKFSAPVGCIALGLIGAPLGMMANRRGSGGGFGLGVLMIVANYVLWMLGQTLGSDGRLPPVVAMWAPNVIMGAIGLYLLMLASEDRAPDFSLKWLWNIRKAKAQKG